jgi:hypothetical protein
MRIVIWSLAICACYPVDPGPPGSSAPIAHAAGSSGSVPIYDSQSGDLGFAPGIDAGYYIVTNGQGGWVIEWTADARLWGGSAASFDGKLSCMGTAAFAGVASKSFEADDSMSMPRTTEIDFSSVASTGFDGLQFTAGPEGVTFDLTIDGERRPDLVFFLQDGRLVTPATVPFILR